MAYRWEQDKYSNKPILIIDGFERGVADSPYEGISNMRNVNIHYLKGSAYVNYKRQRINTAGGNTTFTASTSPSQLNYTGLTLNVGDAVTLTTTGTLPNPLATSTTYFVQARTSSTFQLASTLGGSAIVITTTGTGTHTLTLTTMGNPMYFTQSTGENVRTYIQDDNGRIWQDTGTKTGTSFPYFVLLNGNDITTGSQGKGIAYFKDYLFAFSGTLIQICGNGNNASGVTSTNWRDVNGAGFFASTLSVDLTVAPVAGATSGTLDNSWPGVTGTYQISFDNGNQVVAGSFTNGSTAVTWFPAINSNITDDTISVSISPTSEEHMSIVATDDRLYFCNGYFVGAIFAPDGQVFNYNDENTMRVNYAALTLPQTDTSIWLSELRQNLLVAGESFIYPWDRVSTSYNVPLPINEQPVKMLNILNTVYITTGAKGDVYETNGYQLSLLRKIPDSFLGKIDPTWSFGGLMFHRNRLWFGAHGNDGNGNEICGIFSLDLNTGIFTCESENSYGYDASDADDATNILVDLNQKPPNNVSSYRPDRYYSAWSNNNIGGVDYNDETPWENFEPVIETDLIPVGTNLNPTTFENCEYKLDRLLAANDQIRLSFRTNFTEAYMVIGTTNGSTNQVLSESFNSNINTAQWVQFKVEFACDDNNSSFIPLREIRLY